MPGKRVMYNVPRHILAAGKNSGFLLPSKPALGTSAQPERQHLVLPKVAQRLSAKVEKNVPSRGMYGEAIRTGRKPVCNFGDIIMDMTITVNTNINVAQLLEGVEPRDLKIDTYEYIMDNVNKVNVSSDEAFQRRFNSFYINGYGASAAWRTAYYAYFQEVKNNPDKQTFETIIKYFYETENLPPYNTRVDKRIEFSFSSKLLATIQPDKPIWDDKVSNFFGVGKPNNIARAIQRYADLENWYKSFLQTQDANNWIAAFDSAFPDYTWISKTKKIDFIIWYQER